jgi:hypothetical protein
MKTKRGRSEVSVLRADSEIESCGRLSDRCPHNDYVNRLYQKESYLL